VIAARRFIGSLGLPGMNLARRLWRDLMAVNGCHVLIVLALLADPLARHAIMVAVQAPDFALGEVEAASAQLVISWQYRFPAQAKLLDAALPDVGTIVAGRLGATLSIVLRGAPFPGQHALRSGEARCPRRASRAPCSWWSSSGSWL
jgi:hypothetical protein